MKKKNFYRILNILRKKFPSVKFNLKKNKKSIKFNGLKLFGVYYESKEVEVAGKYISKLTLLTLLHELIHHIHHDNIKKYFTKYPAEVSERAVYLSGYSLIKIPIIRKYITKDDWKNFHFDDTIDYYLFLNRNKLPKKYKKFLKQAKKVTKRKIKDVKLFHCI